MVWRLDTQAANGAKPDRLLQGPRLAELGVFLQPHSRLVTTWE